MADPLTVDGAIRVYLEGHQDVLGHVPIYGEGEVPPRQPMPYLIVHGPHTAPKDPTSAPRSGGNLRIHAEVAIDIWQHTRAATDTGSPVYDRVLPQVVGGLMGKAKLKSGLSRLWGCRYIDGPAEIPNPLAANVKHHVVTVQVPMDLPTTRP